MIAEPEVMTERKKPGPPPALPNRRSLSVYLDGDSFKVLEALAERRRLSMSELARRLILRGLPKDKG